MLHLAIVIFLLFGTPQDQEELTITSVHFEKNGDIHQYRENVVATYSDLKVEADTLTWDRSTNIVTAENNVRYTNGQEHLKADRVTFDVSTKAGDFKQVSGEVGPGFFISAEEAHRTEDGKYQLKNATVTTCCDGPRPGWSLSLARAMVDPEKRVTAKGSVLRLESIPVFYLPYVTVPNTERPRSTGFLAPSTSTSTTKGRAVRESFYWAINRSADATFTGEYFTKRGPAGAVDFRAIPDKTSWIQVQTLFARDRLGQGGRSARIMSYGDLPNGFRGKT